MGGMRNSEIGYRVQYETQKIFSAAVNNEKTTSLKFLNLSI
jgi:hypothetical protein